MTTFCWLTSGLYDKQYSSWHIFSIIILVLVTSSHVVLRMQIWGLLYIQIMISRLSGNTVKIKPNYLPNPFDFWHISLQNRSNWLKIQVVTSISYNLTPRLRKLVILEVLSSKKRFSTASSKFPSASFVGHQKLPEIGSKIRQVSYFKQILLIQNFLIYTWFQTFY